MKKTISVDVCDICEEQIGEGRKRKCDLCGKEFCEDCGDIIFDDDNQAVSIMRIKICSSCFDDERNSEVIEDEISKFFKQKDVKEVLKSLREKLKVYLKNIIMLRNLGEKQDGR